MKIRLTSLLGAILAASCISIAVYPSQPEEPLTFDKLEQMNDSLRSFYPPLPPARLQRKRLIEKFVKQEAVRAGIEPELLMAVVLHESGGNPEAINRDDPSYGLGQVMPRWWRYVFVEECGAEATPETLMDPQINLCYTAHILRYAHGRYSGDRSSILSYYNTGTPHRGITNGYVHDVERFLQ